MPLTKLQAEQSLAPYARDLRALVTASLGDWLARPPSWLGAGRRSRASVMFDQMAARAEVTFKGMAGVHLIRRFGVTHVVFRDHIAVRFKKLDSDGTVATNPTFEQQSLLGQLPLPGMGVMSYLVCGYVLDTSESRVERALLCLYDGGSNRPTWSIDLDDLMRSTSPAPVPMSPAAATTPTTPNVRIVARRKNPGTGTH